MRPHCSLVRHLPLAAGLLCAGLLLLSGCYTQLALENDDAAAPVDCPDYGYQPPIIVVIPPPHCPPPDPAPVITLPAGSMRPPEEPAPTPSRGDIGNRRTTASPSSSADGTRPRGSSSRQ